jgi:hypothetical protein
MYSSIKKLIKKFNMKYSPLKIINSKSKEIDWVRIFLLSEFRQYLKFNQLLTLTILSSNTRSALKKLIFRKLTFSACKFIETEGYFTLSNSESNLFSKFSKFSDELYKTKKNIDVKPYTTLELQIDLEIEKFEKDVGIYEGFVNELNIFDLFTVGYYIFPAFIQFQNLKSLSLTKCSVSYSAWCIINYTLNCLKALRIDGITFIVSTNENFDENKLIIGKCLASLEIDNCKYWTTDLPFEANKFIFNTIEDKSHDPIKLPLISVPTLREVIFSNYRFQNGWLAGFLNLNPQLAALTVEHTEIDQLALNTLTNSSNLIELSITCFRVQVPINRNLEFPNLPNIKKLNTESVCELSFNFINDIILSCSNLKSLSYILGLFSDHQAMMNALYTQTLPNLPNLNYLNIGSDYEGLIDNIDRRIFTKVEHLEMWSYHFIVMRLELPSYPIYLKKLTISYDGTNSKDEEVKKKFEKFDSWKCKFKKNKVICSKLV